MIYFNFHKKIWIVQAGNSDFADKNLSMDYTIDSRKGYRITLDGPRTSIVNTGCEKWGALIIQHYVTI